MEVLVEKEEKKLVSEELGQVVSESETEIESVDNNLLNETEEELEDLEEDEVEESNSGVKVTLFEYSGRILYFDYPKFLRMKRAQCNFVMPLQELLMSPEMKQSAFSAGIQKSQNHMQKKPREEFPSVPMTWACKWDRFCLDVVLTNAGMKKVMFDDNLMQNKTCSLIWGKHPKSNAKTFFDLRQHQRFNHIPGSRHITRKDSLVKTMNSFMKTRKMARKFNFVPQSFCLPEELKEFRRVLGLKGDGERDNPLSLNFSNMSSIPSGNNANVRASLVTFNEKNTLKRNQTLQSVKDDNSQEFEESSSDQIENSAKQGAQGQVTQKNRKFEGEFWISKPAAGSKASGIKIFSKADVFDGVRRNVNKTIIQRYISNPYLIDGKKFDLRLYVLVTSFNPLRIYFFPEGLVRFCAEEYSQYTGNDNSGSPSLSKNKGKLLGHITNYAFNKGTPNYVKSDETNNFKGSKWLLSDLIAHISKERSISVAKTVTQRIKDVIIKTCIACTKPAISEQFNLGPRFEKKAKLCFELLGFDILLDDNLKPWLMECNLSPSLSCDSKIDLDLKTKLMCDALYLVGIPYKKNNPRRHEQETSIYLNQVDGENDADKSGLVGYATRTLKNLRKTFSMKVENTRKTNYSKHSTGKKSFFNSLNSIATGKFNTGKNFNELQPFEKEMIQLGCEEFFRKGHFERIFPPVNVKSKEQKEGYNSYIELFDSQDRYNNCLVKDFERPAFYEIFGKEMSQTEY